MEEAEESRDCDEVEAGSWFQRKKGEVYRPATIVSARRPQGRWRSTDTGGTGSRRWTSR